MELIVIDETKLKIMLTPPDMRHYDLHAERMTTANAATRNAFRHIFDDARERIGFDTSGERLLVQLYTSRGGGCEIFVTKLCAEDDLASLESSDAAPLSDHHQDARETSAEDALLARLAKEETMSLTPVTSSFAESAHRAEPPETVAYRFLEAEDLFALCRRLVASGYDGESEVYISDDRRAVWYLFLTPAAGDEIPPFVREYATDVSDADTLRLYLTEHGRVICASGAAAVMGCI